jgi:hypothetical protein
MLKAAHDVYREGKMGLSETPEVGAGARALVTFLPPAGDVDLRQRGIAPEEAAERRWQFGAAAEDWHRPEMSVYHER